MKKVSAFLICFSIIINIIGVNAEDNSPYLEVNDSTGYYDITVHNISKESECVFIYILYGGYNMTTITDIIVKKSSGYNCSLIKGKHDSYIKVLVWNSIENMQSLCRPLTYNLRKIDYILSKGEKSDESVDIKLKPDVGLQVLDYIEIYNYVTDEYGNFDAQYAYEVNVNEFETPIVNLNGKKNINIKCNGIYIFHAKNEAGKDIYQIINIEELITAPEVTDCTITLNDDNKTATIAVKASCNPLAGYTKIGIGKMTLGSSSTYMIGEESRLFFNSNNTILLLNNQAQVFQNGKYILFCMDSWGNASKKVIEINCIPSEL